MADKVITLNAVEEVAHLKSVLSSENHQHNGFPVIDQSSGKLIGLILRSRLLSLLKHKKFAEKDAPVDLLKLKDIRNAYPRFYPISQEIGDF